MPKQSESASPPTGDQSLTEGMHKTAKNDAFYGQVANYMFWIATSIGAMLVGATLMGGGTEGLLAKGAGVLGIGETGLMAGMGAMSLAGLAGSIAFSKRAAAEREDNDLLYSRKQAKDIARAISKEHAMTPVIIPVPVVEAAASAPPAASRADGKTWAQATSATSRQGLAGASWADYITAQQTPPSGEIKL